MGYADSFTKGFNLIGAEQERQKKLELYEYNKKIRDLQFTELEKTAQDADKEREKQAREAKFPEQAFRFNSYMNSGDMEGVGMLFNELGLNELAGYDSLTGISEADMPLLERQGIVKPGSAWNPNYGRQLAKQVRIVDGALQETIIDPRSAIAPTGLGKFLTAKQLEQMTVAKEQGEQNYKDAQTNKMIAETHNLLNPQPKQLSATELKAQKEMDQMDAQEKLSAYGRDLVKQSDRGEEVNLDTPEAYKLEREEVEMIGKNTYLKDQVTNVKGTLTNLNEGLEAYKALEEMPDTSLLKDAKMFVDTVKNVFGSDKSMKDLTPEEYAEISQKIQAKTKVGRYMVFLLKELSGTAVSDKERENFQLIVTGNMNVKNKPTIMATFRSFLEAQAGSADANLNSMEKNVLPVTYAKAKSSLRQINTSLDGYGKTANPTQPASVPSTPSNRPKQPSNKAAGGGSSLDSYWE